jgi:hypothetical protein
MVGPSTSSRRTRPLAAAGIGRDCRMWRKDRIWRRQSRCGSTAASTLLEVAERPWDQLRYGELMQTYRLLSTQVTQYNLGLTLALITLLGFAVDRESWGLAALGVALEALMFFIIEIHRRASMVLLSEAAELERHAGDASTTEAMHALVSGKRGSTRAAGQFALIVAMICHILLVCYFAIGQDWSFEGGGPTE